jgi:hypothetical protein
MPKILLYGLMQSSIQNSGAIAICSAGKLSCGWPEDPLENLKEDLA